MGINPSDTQTEQERTVQEQLTQILKQQEELKQRLQILENTLQAVAMQDGDSIGGECQECNQCLLVIKNGVLTCPMCNHRQPL